MSRITEESNPDEHNHFIKHAYEYVPFKWLIMSGNEQRSFRLAMLNTAISYCKDIEEDDF